MCMSHSNSTAHTFKLAYKRTDDGVFLDWQCNFKRDLFS